ncbi:hypothetical protein KEM54_004709 [Ascosphaera aggregata]|nr:hypothetical protein KEM54_004709 [Ascosphaera aggregata]
MNLLSLALTGAMAIQPSLSFLLVPKIPEVEGLSSDALFPSVDAIDVDLRCSQCPFPAHAGDNALLSDGVDSVLSLNLSTSGDCLLLNDMQIFPRPGPDHLPILTAPLRRIADDVGTSSLPFGYVFEMLPSVSDKHDDSLGKFMNFRLTVVDLDGVPINMQPLEIRMIRTAAPNQEFFFTEIEIGPNMPDDGIVSGWRACNGSPACYHKLLAARLKDMLLAAKARADKVAGGAKGCMGKLHDKIGAMMAGFQEDKPHHHHHDHHHDHDHDGENASPQGMSQHMSDDDGRRKMNHLVHVLHSVAVALMWAILGVIVYAIAFLFARSIARLHRRFRGCKGGCKRNRSEAGDDEERVGLVSDTDAEALKDTSEVHEGEAPPKYEESDLPKEIQVEVNEKQ